MQIKEKKAQPEKKLLGVWVWPGAQRFGVEKLAPREYRVSVISPPKGGKANKEVIARLAEYLGVSPSRVRIVRGKKSRLKLVAVDSKLKHLR